MPYLRFKSFDEEGLRRALPLLVDEFAQVAAVPREIVKVELLTITPLTATPRSLEIFMFPRTKEKHDAIAAHIYALLSRFGYQDTHIFLYRLIPPCITSKDCLCKISAGYRNISLQETKRIWNAVPDPCIVRPE
jgi:Domain of unknown function (DUF1904).